jgi:putative colanic acid biosynthesis UDP-glucose lipid carrier transferase
MTHPVIFKQTVSIAVAAMLQALVSPAIVYTCLYVTSIMYGADFDAFFKLLAIIAIAISVVLLRPSTNMTEHLLVHRVPLAASMLLRWIAVLGILLAIGYVTKFSAHFSRRVILTWALTTPVFLIIGALILREFMRMLLLDPANARSVVFAGCNEVSVALAERLSKNSELCMKVVGFFDDRGAERLEVPETTALLGKLPDLAPYVKSHGVEVIFIALPIRHVRRVMDLTDQLRDTTASIYYVPDIFVFDLIQAQTGEIMGIPVVSMCETPFHGVRGAIKRTMDVVISLLILVFALPLFIGIGLLVRWSSKGPVIFRQRRYGLDGREITVCKFRTMTVTEDGPQIAQATREDSRITPIGKLLRRFSLDELPQLINVLQGRMSLVGPRPHAVAHNEEYRKLIKGYMVRHKVLPGITGLAQVNGCRGETARIEEMQARVNYDLDYLRHWSPILDFKILVLTVIRLLGDDRAY